MASVKTGLHLNHDDDGKPKLKKSGKAMIYIIVSHEGKTRYIPTVWEVEPKFITETGFINSKHPDHATFNKNLINLTSEYNSVIQDIGNEVINMDINSIVNKLKNVQKHSSGGFMAYMKFRTEELKKENRLGYAQSYSVTLKHLENYVKRPDFAFKELTINFLNGFRTHLLTAGQKTNTIRINLNNVRTVFYYAIDNEVIKPQFSPFRKFKIEQEQTAKRNIDLQDLKKLLEIQPKTTKQQKRAIDIFFLIFYLCGINLKDLVYLKHTDIHKGRLLYKRFKTGRNYSIKIQPQAMDIINKYQGKKYLLCLMDEKEKISPDRMNEADHDILSQLNKLLKTVVTNAKFDFKLTTYTPRHTWATIASDLNISKDIISSALGHGKNTMTDIYINFSLSKVDEANETIIKALHALPKQPKKQKPKVINNLDKKL